MKSGYIAIIIVVLCVTVVSGQTAGGILSGKITDQDGQPLAGAVIRIENSLLGTYSGADGRYSLKVNNIGSVRVVFSFTGYGKETRELDVQGNITEDVILYRSVLMTGEIIVSATRAGTTTPVAYTSLQSEQVRSGNNGQDIPFLLALTPSLVETSEAGAGIGYTNLRIRGTDANRINVTIDGIPLNDPESQQVFWVDLPDLASSVEDIQVQRGVGTSSNGAGAFGASVNILTKGISAMPFADINTTAGSFNTLKNTVSAGTGLLGGKFAVQLRYSDIKSAGYVKRTWTDNRSGALSAIYRTGKSILKANIILGEEHTGISWWGVPSDSLSADRRFNPAGMYTDESGKLKFYNNESDNYWQNHYQLIFNSELGSALNLHAAFHYTTGKGYYEEYSEDQNYSNYGILPVIIGDTTLASTDLVRRKWMSNDFYGVVYSLSYRKGRLDAVFGGAANIYRGRHYGIITWMQYAGLTPLNYQWYFNKALKSEYSIYARANYRINESVSAFGDIQYRSISYRMKGPDDDLRDITQDHKYGFFNPKAGLFFRITSSQDAYLSFSIANREPTRSDFKEATGDPATTPKAETLYDAEGGYNLRSGRVSLGLNVYGMFYDNQLIPTGQLSDVGYPVMTNVKKSSRIGIEVVSEWKPADIIDWKGSLTLSRNKIPEFTGYYTDYNTSDWSSEYKSRNYGTVDIAYSPSVTAVSDLALKFPEYVNVHFISKAVGKQYFDNTMSQARKIDPYFVNNLVINFSISTGKEIEFFSSLFINNLLNSKYVSNGYGGLWFEDGNEKSWSYYFPQAGINFLLKIGFRF